MSTGYGWEGLRQVCATLLGTRHVPERICGNIVYLRALLQMFATIMLTTITITSFYNTIPLGPFCLQRR